MRYPSKEKLKEMDEKLKNIEGTRMIGANASPAEKFRWELCQSLVKYMVENGLSQIEFSQKLKIDQARVSEIVNHRIDKVSTDKLISYSEKINPNVTFKIAQ